MRAIKIETFSYRSGELVDSISVPATLARSLVKLLPRNALSRFDENGDQLRELLETIADPTFNGTILDITDVQENERVVISAA
ncbi:hypothetical protein BIY21_02990 [Vibrio ponticus]|uniref:Uncharacterized protein n=1 Tax=Vibrio ponticus TaxID=265668 RepID=A0ABX3FBL5_9VIBR|nr:MULTISPECIES: hypothetical protein [Vibrio]OLQ89087.1 hypothetical protein BIY21_02990 [Vibrio ponticus]